MFQQGPAQRSALGTTQISFTYRSTHPMRTKTSRLLSALALSAISTSLLVACNKTPEAAPTPTPPPPITLGTQVDDAVITASVKSALLANPTINSLDLQVESRKGVVQLSGFVENQSQIDQALAAARSVTGVTAVENGVSLKGSASTVGTKIDDATVTGRVKAALLTDPDVKSFDISVLTYKGEVQLTGFVDNPGQIEQAAKIARATEGASSVKNELMTKR
ncbi:MAG: transporter [Methylibium sp.]|nr:transporter [Methylibium sp.]